MSIRLDIERKRKKPKNAAFAAHHVVASAGNTKVKIANDDGPAADSASASASATATESTGFIISSTSKTMIQSIMTLFAAYDQISTQHKITANSADAISHDIAASHVKLEFKLVKRGKGSGGGHEVAIVQRNASSKAVTCTSLRDFMEARTTAMSYQRVLRMTEMIYKQMTALEGLGLAPPYYGLDDILVINDSFFCFINDAKLFAIEAGSEPKKNSRRRIDVTQAISRTAAFFAPELIGEISALPYSADVQSSYYSYGLLVAYCATFNSKLITASHEKGQEGENERKEKEEKEEKEKEEKEEEDEEERDEEERDEEEQEEKRGDEEIDQQSGGKRRRRRNKHKQNQKQQQEQYQDQDQYQEREKHRQKEQPDQVKTHNRQPDLMRALEPLQYTKLYWLILRCCDPDVSQRSIIYL
jgi:hypothetical protein